jgi:hypothetical protein
LTLCAECGGSKKYSSTVSIELPLAADRRFPVPAAVAEVDERGQRAYVVTPLSLDQISREPERSNLTFAK